MTGPVRLLVVLAAVAAPGIAVAEDLETRDRKDRDETTRTLERALVRQGGLVLRPGVFELEPGLVYAYREVNAVRRDALTSALTLRLGLPWGTQGDVQAPYVLLDRQAGLGTTSGLGDVDVALTKQLLVGGPARSVPDLLLTVHWKTATGASGGSLPPGTGTHSIAGFLTAVERDDPLVLLVSIYYSWNLRARDLDRGDAIGAILRMLLAATPNTSLLLGIDAASFFATTLQGQSVPGSERLIAVLDLGLATILWRDLFLNVTAGIGITPAAPDFQIAIALPFRL